MKRSSPTAVCLSIRITVLLQLRPTVTDAPVLALSVGAMLPVGTDTAELVPLDKPTVVLDRSVLGMSVVVVVIEFIAPELVTDPEP